MADTYTIKPDNMVVTPLTTVQYRARKVMKADKLKKKSNKGKGKK